MVAEVGEGQLGVCRDKIRRRDFLRRFKASTSNKGNIADKGSETGRKYSEFIGELDAEYSRKHFKNSR